MSQTSDIGSQIRTKELAYMYEITENISQELTRARYRIRTGESLHAENICFVASKVKFFPKYIPLSLVSTHIVVMEQDDAAPHDINELFETGFQLAKRINRIPLLRGMQFCYAILPLIIGNNPSSELLLHAATAPKSRFSLFSLPVVINTSTNRVVFFEGFKTVGGMIWPVLQEIVIKHVESRVDALRNKEVG